jgi:hypothetical protein
LAWLQENKVFDKTDVPAIAMAPFFRKSLLELFISFSVLFKKFFPDKNINENGGLNLLKEIEEC